MASDEPRTAPEAMPPAAPGEARTGEIEGSTIDSGKGRIFPCGQCGADLEFHIGQQNLKCPFCGHTEDVGFADSEGDEEPAVEEQDFRAMLAKLAELRKEKTEATGDTDTQEVRCESCGANVSFQGTLTSSECAFCGSPIQRKNVHECEERVPVDGILPFRIDREKSRECLRKWVKSRWFAPNEFKKRGAKGKFSGVYLPFWTFDSHTFSRYKGQRGEYYWVTVGSGDNKRRERRTRWYPASGTVRAFFDDVLVSATEHLPKDLLEDLEPWPLSRLGAFDPKLLAGFLAQTYDVELDRGFIDAKRRIDDGIQRLVKRDIGGDTQRIHWVKSKYDPITYKHLLLPVWLLSYKFREKTFRVVINAITGEVQGERPWSWIKITLATLVGLALAGAAAFFGGVFE